VDWNKCTGCVMCTEKCPTKVKSEFNMLLDDRKAIYTPFPQAVPNKVIIDPENCLYFRKGRCRICEKTCSLGAVDFEQKDWFEDLKVGAIVVATGFDLYDKENIEEYRLGYSEDVIDGITFERLLSASGPTGGKLVRPSDGKVPKEVVFIQCAGSRNPEHGLPYCSKICCMYTAKHAILYKHRVHDGQVYVFYIDIRAGGKGYEEFVTRAMEEEDTVYIRGRVSKVFSRDGGDRGGRLVVWGVDTLTERKVEIAADMVVVAAAIVPSARSRRLAEVLGISVDEFGFYTASDTEMTQVEIGVPAVFLAGSGLGPQDIPETVAQASGAAAKVLTFFGAEKAKRRKDTDRGQNTDRQD